MQARTHQFRPLQRLSDGDAHERIRAARARLGDGAVLLCHHYQRADVYQYADLTGDSLKLSRLAAETDAEYIVFCGVHFMAEVADIMSKPHQMASCPTSPPAARWPTWPAWPGRALLARAHRSARNPRRADHAGHLHQLRRRPQGLLRRARRHRAHLHQRPTILDWAFAQREKVLFFPDQHLGRWTGFNKGIPLDEMVVWDPDLEYGGLTPGANQRPRSCCGRATARCTRCSSRRTSSSSATSTPTASSSPTRERPRGVPPVRLRRLHRVHHQGRQKAAPGTRWLVGTELNLVNRLAEEVKHEGKIVQFMAPPCACARRCSASTPAPRLDPRKPRRRQGGQRISVPEHEAALAKVALERMLARVLE